MPADAHGLSTSYTEIAITPARLAVTCLVSLDEILAHFPVSATDERMARQDLDAAVRSVFAFLGEHLTLAVDGRPVALVRGAYRAYPGATFLRLELSLPLERAPAEIAHRCGCGVLRALRLAAHQPRQGHGSGGQIQQAALTADRPRASFVVGYRSLLAQCAAFIKLGIGHIFLGYDHIVFLFALIVIGGRLGAAGQDRHRLYRRPQPDADPGRAPGGQPAVTPD